MPIRNLTLESLESRDLLTTYFVTSEADTGAGSLREGIEQANLDSEITRIVVQQNVSEIHLDSTIEYSGRQNLNVRGNGVEVTSNGQSRGKFDLFESNGGANLRVYDTTFSDGANGISVPVPAGKTGTIRVILNNVTLKDNGLFGAHIDDQVSNSSASIFLRVVGSSVTGNGTDAIDYDGVRVDEGGEGSIRARIIRTSVNGNGADGLELNERGPGAVRAYVNNSSFDANGFFNRADFEDGLDIDETGSGNLWFIAVNSTFNDNYDQGLDLDEEMGGNLYASLTQVNANRNMAEGIKIDEKFDANNVNSNGTLTTVFSVVTANDNAGEEGIAITEEGNGSLWTTFTDVRAYRNGKEGIDLSENGVGGANTVLTSVFANNNGDDGIHIDENDRGRFYFLGTTVISQSNAAYGVSLRQESDWTTDGGLGYLSGENLAANLAGPLMVSGFTLF